MERKAVKETVIKGETAYLILEHSFFTPAFQVKDVSAGLSLEKKDPNNIPRAMEKLLKLELVEKVPKTESFYRITEEGIRFLAGKDGYYAAIRKRAEERRKAYREKRAELNEKYSLSVSLIKERHGGADQPGYDVELKTAGATLKKQLAVAEKEFLSDQFAANFLFQANRSYTESNEMRLSVWSYVRGAGVNTYAKDKPSLAWLISHTNPSFIHSESEDVGYLEPDMETLRAVLKKGVFYSATELRLGVKGLGRDTEPFNGSRISGIAVTDSSIYMVYNTVKPFIRWLPYQEENLMSELTSLFSSPDYWRDASPSCIVTGKRYSLVPALVTGYVHGRMHDERKRYLQLMKKMEKADPADIAELVRMEKENQAVNRKIIENKRTHADGRSNAIYFNTDYDRFGQVYYVPLNRRHVGELKSILSPEKGKGYGCPESLSSAAFSWFSAHEGFEETVGNPSINGYCTENGTEAAFIPVADVMQVRMIRDRETKTTVVTTRGLAPYISQALGTKAMAFYDMETGKEMHVTSFDDFGFPKGIEDRYERLGKINSERNAKKEKKEYLTIRLSREVLDGIREKAEREGTAPSAVAAKIIEDNVNYPRPKGHGLVTAQSY